MGMLCSQGLGYLIGIIFIKYEQIAIGVSIGVYLLLVMFCNIFTPIKEMPHLFQVMSDVAFTKFVYYSVLIKIYGFDRCPSDQLSLVLYKYGMNDQVFWNYTRYLVIYFICLRVVAFIVLYFKVNTSFFTKKSQNISYKIFKILEKSRQNSRITPDKRNNSFIVIILDKCIDQEKELKTNEDNINKLSVAWIDLTLKSKNQTFGEEKIILRQLNGCVEFGSLNALMGPSGAGKTSLLKCLNGRYQNQLSDDTQIYLSKFKLIRTCFISQDVSEHLIRGLTAKQAMIYE